MTAMLSLLYLHYDQPIAEEISDIFSTNYRIQIRHYRIRVLYAFFEN
jgi:hypothetical protein